jgi:hypothetical protein
MEILDGQDLERTRSAPPNAALDGDAGPLDANHVE